MQLIGVEVADWLILLAIVVALLYWDGTRTYKVFRDLGIPYLKPALPYLGHSLQIMTKSPVQLDSENRKLCGGKIYGMFMSRSPRLMVGDAEFLKEITIKQLQNFRNHKSLLEGEDNIHTRHVGVIEDDHWKHIRSILTPTFTSGKLKQMFPVIKRCGDKLNKHLQSTGSSPVVIKDYTSGYTMDVIACTAFGLDLDTQATTDHPFVQHAAILMGGGSKSKGLLENLKMFMRLLLILVFPNFLRLMLCKYFGISFINKESLKYFEDIIEKLVQERKGDQDSENQKDFVSICSRKIVDLDELEKDKIYTTPQGFRWTTEGMTKKDFVANAMIFFSAGYETTATALQLFFYAMATNPDIQNKLYEHLSHELNDDEFTYEELQKLEYLDWCVSEALRMYPPATRIERYTNTDTVVNGISISKGVDVIGQVYAIHHDPQYWPEPEVFNPERFAPENKTDIQQYAWLPFGAGGRQCIANRLALLEIKVAVVKSILCFRFERTAKTIDTKDIKLGPFSGFFLPTEPLVIAAVPRQT